MDHRRGGKDVRLQQLWLASGRRNRRSHHNRDSLLACTQVASFTPCRGHRGGTLRIRLPPFCPIAHRDARRLRSPLRARGRPICCSRPGRVARGGGAAGAAATAVATCGGHRGGGCGGVEVVGGLLRRDRGRAVDRVGVRRTTRGRSGPRVGARPAGAGDVDRRFTFDRPRSRVRRHVRRPRGGGDTRGSVGQRFVV
jgi:hypothetical protein